MNTAASPPHHRAPSTLVQLALALALCPGCLVLTEELSPSTSGAETSDSGASGQSTTSATSEDTADPTTGAPPSTTGETGEAGETGETGETEDEPPVDAAWIGTWSEVAASNYHGVALGPDGMIYAAGWGELANTFTRRGALHGYTPDGARTLEYFEPSLDGWRMTDVCVTPGGALFAVAEQIANQDPHTLADDLRLLRFTSEGELIDDHAYDGEITDNVGVEGLPRARCDEAGQSWVALTVKWPDGGDNSTLVLRASEGALASEHLLDYSTFAQLGFGLDTAGVVHLALIPADLPSPTWARFAPSGELLAHDQLDELNALGGPVVGFVVGQSGAQFFGYDDAENLWTRAYDLDAQPLWTASSDLSATTLTRHAALADDDAGFVAGYSGPFPEHDLELVQLNDDGEVAGSVTIETFAAGLGNLEVAEVAAHGAGAQIAVGRGQAVGPDQASGAFVARYLP